MSTRRNYWDVYMPSVPLAIVTTSVFALLTLWHGWRLIKARTWFCLPVFIGGLCEYLPNFPMTSGHSNTLHS